MAKKKKQSPEETEQLSLPLEEEIDDDWLTPDEDEDYFQTSERTVSPPQQELLTLKLLKQAITSQNPDDQVMVDFAEFVLPNLLRVAIGVTAKGGKFFDTLDSRRGRENVRRDNAGDQSLNTHLLNGLFPANLIERRLQEFRYYGKKSS